MSDEEALPLVIDNGSGIYKAGIAGDDDPKILFPSVVGKVRNPKDVAMYQSDTFLGNEAHKRKDKLSLTYPIERGIITNWEDMEKIWHQTFYNELRVEPKDHAILLTETPSNPKENREKMCEIMFETFNCPSFNVSTQPVLSLYSCGRTDGIVCEIGDGVAHIVPIVDDGIYLPEAVSTMNLAGKDITENLKKLLNEKGYSSADNESVRVIKEKLGCVALDFDEEMKKEETVKNYELPDGKVINVGNERFRCGEILFKPDLIGIQEKGIHQLVYNSIKKDDKINKNIHRYALIMCGGATMMKGFAERITNEVNKLIPEPHINMRKTVKKPYRKHSAWIGGAMLAALSSLEKWISKDEYFDSGCSIVHTKCN